MTNIFAYGTLMCDDIMREVAGLQLSFTQGILNNYQRYTVKNEIYPALIPAEYSRVIGIIYYDISNAAWDRLDRFEGEMYVRQKVNVLVNNKEMISAVTYVLKPEFSHYITDIIWDYEKFLKNGKERFLNYYNGFKLI
jgi:gamma-glutamylcyclotransferase (GGCT)/AIG2-like uncharacterized protein YtfP